MEILDYLMGELKKQKVDDVVLTYHNANVKQLKLVDNKIVNSFVESLKDLGIFVVKDKKIFTTSYKDAIDEKGLGKNEGGLTELKKKHIDKFVGKIMKFLRAGEAKSDYNGINDKKFKYKSIKEEYDPKIKRIDCVDYVRRGINVALKEGAKRTSGTFEVHDLKSTILTSHGIEFSEKKSELYFSLRSFVDKDESGHANAVSRMVSKLNPDKVGGESGRIAKDSKNPVAGKRGKYDVIFAPLAFAPILNNIGDAASIFSVESGLSFFCRKRK